MAKMAVVYFAGCQMKPSDLDEQSGEHHCYELVWMEERYIPWINYISHRHTQGPLACMLLELGQIPPGSLLMGNTFPLAIWWIIWMTTNSKISPVSHNLPKNDDRGARLPVGSVNINYSSAGGAFAFRQNILMHRESCNHLKGVLDLLWIEKVVWPRSWLTVWWSCSWEDHIGSTGNYCIDPLFVCVRVWNSWLL